MRRKELRPRPTRNPETDLAARTAGTAVPGGGSAAPDVDLAVPGGGSAAPDVDLAVPGGELAAPSADPTGRGPEPPAPNADPTAPGPESPAPKSGVTAAGGSLPRRIRRAAAMRGYDGLFRTALWVLVALVLVTLVGQLAGIGGRPDAIVGPRLQPPAASWPLGTDNLGRSLLPRLFQGVGTTLLLSALAVTCTAVISTALGVLAGYRGGRTAEMILRIGDVLYAFPAIVLAVLVAAVLGPGRTAALAAIVLVTVPLMTRMVGIAARAVARREFVTAARISGVRAPMIMLRHILPNVAGTVAVQGTYALSVGILVEGGLSFLGYGVQLPDASLGLLIQEGGLYMVGAPWLIIAPGVVLIAAIMAVNLIGDSLRDRFEPRETRSLV
ncbi:ABC transporter permease subunit [Streptomyces sp. NBC_00075]|uniref:ABC transporter permease n=1 Tax=Streptomyces sp. NBC_00075 TaxID=2975641 RepID=UPI00324D510A